MTPSGIFLYVAEPGIRNYVEYGGVGVLVFDMDAGYRFVRRIPTFEVRRARSPTTSKGLPPTLGTGRLYVSTIKRMAAFDLATDKVVWNRAYEGGCDRLAVSPDGTLLYVPSFEGPHWHVIDAKTGNVIAKIVTEFRSAQHDLRSRRAARLSGRVFIRRPCPIADPAHASRLSAPLARSAIPSDRSPSTRRRRSAS